LSLFGTNDVIVINSLGSMIDGYCVSVLNLDGKIFLCLFKSFLFKLESIILLSTLFAAIKP
jgi:hypothetical protein